MPDFKLSDTAKSWIIPILLTAFLVSLYFTGRYFYEKYQDEKPKVMTTEEVHDPAKVAKEIHVTTPAAQTIVREMERSGSSTPQITYYVTAPSVEKGAETVAKQIEEKSPEAPAGVLQNSDRTIVTPNEEKQKVDVYKISLRKAHKLKAGATYVDGHAYLSTGYQAGKWEGLIHFDNRTLEPKGGTITYTVLEW
jgi:hypothetical protein